MINERGYWLEKNSHEHKYDETLNNEISKILLELNYSTIVDFGCGPGNYSKSFKNQGFECDCFDGNPFTPEESNGLCSVLDLSETFDLNKKYDCVLSLEVGEHIPNQYEKTYIDNLIRHTKNLIIISWATIGQGGHGHVNEHPNEYITDIFKEHGFTRNVLYEERLRTSSFWWWFKNTIMVFQKN